MIDDFRGPTGPAKKDVPEHTDFIPDLSESSTPESLPTPTQNDATQRVIKPDTPSTEPDIDIDLQTDEASETEASATEAAPQASTQKKPRWWSRIKPWFSGLSKKQKALVVFAVVLLVTGIGTGAYALLRSEPEPEPAPAVIVEPEPEPTTVPNTLTGRQVEPEINDRQVIATVIENSMEARPQAGLKDAGVVFEAIAEGGITRFLALYQDTEPASIGPVRSARPYFVSWAMGFDAALGHVGGSPEALQNIRSWGTKDMDQMFNSVAYQRITNKYAPHNVYTSYDKLQQLAASKRFTSSEFTGFARHEEAKAAETPTARTIRVNISSANYNSLYTYNAETNTYGRTMGGVAHNDERSGEQISPDVVVVMVMNYGIKSNGVHSVYNTVGTGTVYVFQNGVVEEGTWQKTSNESNISFRDSGGRPLLINPGQTWITAVSGADRVNYQP